MVGISSQMWLIFKSENKSVVTGIELKNWKKTGWQDNTLNTCKFTNTEQRHFSEFLKQEYGAVGPEP